MRFYTWRYASQGQGMVNEEILEVTCSHTIVIGAKFNHLIVITEVVSEVGGTNDNYDVFKVEVVDRLSRTILKITQDTFQYFILSLLYFMLLC